MDTAKIENIFKEWQDKSMLTKKGALQVDPIFLSIIRRVFLRGGGYCLSLIIFVPVFLATLHFFLLYWSLRKRKQIDSLDRIFSMLSKSSDAFEKILYPLVEPLLLPILCFNPILLFHKDHLVVSFGWIGRKEKCYYSDVEKITYSQLSKKESLIRILFKGREKPIEVMDTLKMGDVLHLFGSAFRPIYVNEPLCEDMLRLYADLITLGSDPQSQQDGLRCAMKYFSEPKYSDYDYVQELPKMVDLFMQYKTQKRMPTSEYFINRCLSILNNKGVDYDARLDLLSHLFECAYASEEMVDVVELDRLSHIAYYLRIREWDFLSLKYSFEAMKQQRSRRNGKENAQQSERYQSAYSNRLREAYKILELKEKSSLEEVKTAYRKLVKTCHPDTLPPNAKDSEREEAAIRFRTITEAYDFLCAELCAEPVSVAR